MRIRKYMVFRKHLIVLIKFICYQYGLFSLFRQFSLLKYRILYALLVLLNLCFMLEYPGIFCQNAGTMLGFAFLLVKIKNKTETNSMFPIDRLLGQKHHRQAKLYDTNDMDAVNSNRKLGL